MSCPLTSNYALPCRDSIGGIKKLYIATLADYESLAETVSGGDITEFGTPSLVFQSYEQLKETSAVTETITASIQNGTVYIAINGGGVSVGTIPVASGDSLTYSFEKNGDEINLCLR